MSSEPTFIVANDVNCRECGFVTTSAQICILIFTLSRHVMMYFASTNSRFIQNTCCLPPNLIENSRNNWFHDRNDVICSILMRMIVGANSLIHIQCTRKKVHTNSMHIKLLFDIYNQSL